LNTVDFSFPGSISCFSLHFSGVYLRIGRECHSSHGHEFDISQVLLEEFGFSELAPKLSELRPSMDFKETDAETEAADGLG
jgi:hypothetical protein